MFVLVVNMATINKRALESELYKNGLIEWKGEMTKIVESYLSKLLRDVWTSVGLRGGSTLSERELMLALMYRGEKKL